MSTVTSPAVADLTKRDTNSKFEKWWADNGGDEHFGGVLDCAAPVNLEEAKVLFCGAFFAGYKHGSQTKAVNEEAYNILVEMIQEACKAMKSENMPCPWCSGRLSVQNESHDQFCAYQKHKHLFSE